MKEYYMLLGLNQKEVKIMNVKENISLSSSDKITSSGHINEKKDREYAEELNRKADAMLEKYTKIADETFDSVLERLK